MWVITKGRFYVAREGRKKSYTTSLQHARQFATREQAQNDCCGNETIVHINNCF
jgi:hypothetical protein